MPIGLIWDTYCFMTRMINDDVVVVAVDVAVVVSDDVDFLWLSYGVLRVSYGRLWDSVVLA